MALEKTQAKYEIVITKSGSGAAEAAAEIAQFQAAMAKTGAASASASSALHELHGASKATKSAFHELHTVGLLVGTHMAPQLTEAVIAVSGGLHAVRTVSLLTGASLGVVTAALAAVVAGSLVAITVVKELHDQFKFMNEGPSGGPSSGSVRFAIDQKMKQLVEEGKLTKQTMDSFHATLYASDDEAKIREANLLVMAQLRVVEGTKEQEEAVSRLKELQHTMVLESLEGMSKERLEAGYTYQERIKQIDELAKAAGVRADKEMIADEKLAAKEAYNARLEQIATEEKNRQEAASKQKLAEQDRQVTEQMGEFERKLTIEALQGSMSRENQAQHEYDARLNFYNDLYSMGKITEERLTQLQDEALIKRLQMVKKEIDQAKVNIMSTREMSVQTIEGFAGGLSTAMVDFAQNTKNAAQIFGNFARSFLSEIAKMILQMLILRSIKSFIPGLFAGGGTATAAAGGLAPTFAAGGLAGFVSSPTYLPKFNVIAGEAGREMLTVLARPRMMEFGGVEAVVGQAGRQTLAVTSASALASGGGAGGRLVIEITHSDEAKARIIESAVNGAEIRVTQKARQNGPLRDAIKKAV